MSCDKVEDVGAELYGDFAPCIDYPGYMATAEGEIFGPKGKSVRQIPDGSGGLYININGTTIGVHSLILPAFTGIPSKKEWRPKHLNGDRSDNRLENLAWAQRGKRSPRRVTLGGHSA